MVLVAGEASIAEEVLLAYRDLVGAEARLADALAPRGISFRASVANQWPVIHDHLQIYGRGLGRAGLLVLAGAPDAGSRMTGIPFTGPREAREHLELEVAGDASSPAGETFWRAVAELPLDPLFGVAHLAHAIPFDVEDAPEVREASRAHLTRLLALMRPQGVVAVGPAALAALGHALGQPDLVALGHAPEDAWASRWPPGTSLLRYPVAEVPLHPPFRVRVVPLPSLDGPHADLAATSMQRLLGWLVG